MQTFADIYAGQSFALSFELFPPKTTKGEQALLNHVRRLVEFQPSFITCTYGAGGSTQDKTLQIVSRVREEFQLPVATHLTCVGRSVDQLRAFLTQARQRSIDNVVALRGDPPQGATEFQPVAGGYRYANQLVSLIHNGFPEFGIAVAGYPETHRDAPSPTVDLENLKRKVDAGADVVITQLFYNNVVFDRFRQRCEAIGISVPIVPGLLPVTNFAQIQRIATLCGAKLPRTFVDALEAAGDDSDAQFRAGVDYAMRQTQALVDTGVPGIHFYVLNRSEAAEQVLHAVSLPR